MKIGITGGAGFIGHRTAEIAVAKGHKVILIDKDKHRLDRIREQRKLNKAGYVEADISVESVLVSAFRSCDVVIHAAAKVEESGPVDAFRRLNVDGSLTVYRAARKAKVKKFVHLSSVMVYGFDYAENVTEEGPFDGANNPYCITKIESEQALMQEAGTKGNPALLIARPGDVIGAGSRPWVLRPVDLMKKHMFALPDGGRGCMNYIFVDNLIEGLFLLLQKGKHGEAYNFVDGQISWKEYFSRIAGIANAGKPLFIPSFLMTGGIGLLQVGRLAGLKPPLTPEAVRFVKRTNPVSADKARAALGNFTKYSIEQAFGQIAIGLGQSGD